jgi:hypothetical protein
LVATFHLLPYRPDVPTVVMFVQTGHAGTGAPPDDGAAPVNCAPPALALSSDTAPVIASGPGAVGGLSQGNVAS